MKHAKTEWFTPIRQIIKKKKSIFIKIIKSLRNDERLYQNTMSMWTITHTQRSVSSQTTSTKQRNNNKYVLLSINTAVSIAS